MADTSGAATLRTEAAPFGRTDGGGPEVSSFNLDNGLEVVVVPDRRVPVVTHMIWFRNVLAVVIRIFHESTYAVGNYFPFSVIRVVVSQHIELSDYFVL